MRCFCQDKCTVAYVLLVLLSACSGDGDHKLPGDEQTLAEVNGSAITRYDLERALERSISASARTSARAEAERKMLESLVRTRAMALAMEAKLSAPEKLELEKEVREFREERLVQRYIRTQGKTVPVGQAAVTDYYGKHLERFGAGPVRYYELIGGDRPLSGEERTKLTAALANPEKQPDFAKWAERLRAGGLPVTYQSGTADSSVLHPALRKTLADLQPGDSPRAQWVDQRLFVLRTSKVEQRPAAPLAQVAKQIREELAAEQLKQAVHSASGSALKQVKVEYAKR